MAWVYRGRQADLNFPELVTEYNSEVSGSVLKGILEVLFRVLTHSGGGMGAAVDGNKELDGACALERGKREKGKKGRLTGRYSPCIRRRTAENTCDFNIDL